MESQLENSLKQLLNDKLKTLKEYLHANILVCSGPIGNLNENVFFEDY